MVERRMGASMEFMEMTVGRNRSLETAEEEVVGEEEVEEVGEVRRMERIGGRKRGKDMAILGEN
jgi:hypothetical protein